MSILNRSGSGQTWSSFCGVDQSTFEDHLTDVLETLGWAYDVEETDGSFMLGDEPASAYTIETPDGEMTVTVYFASGDPMLRFFFSFRTGGHESLEGVSVVEGEFDENTEPHLRRVLARVAETLPRPPHAVSHHPRFRLAPIARWRIRRRWRRWLE